MQTLQTLRQNPFSFSFIQGLLELLRPVLEGLLQLGYLLGQAVDVMFVRVLPLLQQGHVSLLAGGASGPQQRVLAGVRRRFTGQEVEQRQAAAEAQHNEPHSGQQG